MGERGLKVGFVGEDFPNKDVELVCKDCLDRGEWRVGEVGEAMLCI